MIPFVIEYDGFQHWVGYMKDTPLYINTNDIHKEYYAWKNGIALESANLDLGVIDEYMVLRVLVNDESLNSKSTWKIGNVSTDWSTDMDLAEAIGFPSELTEEQAAQVEAAKFPATPR